MASAMGRSLKARWLSIFSRGKSLSVGYSLEDSEVAISANGDSAAKIPNHGNTSAAERVAGNSFGWTTLEKALFVSVLIAIAVVVVLTIRLAGAEKKNGGIYVDRFKTNNLSNLCMTSSCITEASSLINSLDLSVDPCTDFYSFVCGNWIRNTYLNTNSESQFLKLNRNVVTRARDILEDLTRQQHLPVNKQKARDYYKSCMDESHRDQIGASELLSDLKKFGGWPIIEGQWNASDFDWADLVVQLHNSGYSNNFLFTVKVDADSSNTSRSLIYVTAPSLGLTKIKYYVEPYDKLLTSYKEVIFRMAELLKPDINKNQSMTEIEEALEIELKLANISRRFGSYIKTLQNVQNLAPMLQLERLLKNLLPPDTKLKRAEERIWFNHPMVEGLNKLLEELDNETGKRALANYMFYRVVFRAAKYMSREFYVLYMQILQTDEVVPSLPWKICTSTAMNAFHFSLASIYVAKYLDSKTKGIVTMILEDMRSTVIDEIGNAAWLDDETKAFALLKVRKMKAVMAYNDEIMDDDNLDAYYEQVNITENFYGNVKQLIAFRSRRNMKGLHEDREKYKWTETNLLLNAGAYYNIHRNMIIIPAGILQEAVFATGRPNYINYGHLAFIIGHEITHAFDNRGSFFDPDGNFKKMWSEKTWEKFRKKMKCYTDQYNGYYLPRINATINGSLTLGDNIADNGGLQAAYNAYKLLLQRIGNEKSLPGLPYDEKQLFWISFASVFCGKQTDESLKLYLKENKHAAAKYRVIGTLSNMRGFSKDFRCKSNSTMNPTSRCSLWE